MRSLFLVGAVVEWKTISQLESNMRYARDRCPGLASATVWPCTALCVYLHPACPAFQLHLTVNQIHL